VAKLLLEHGADPNIRDASGETPLHWAVGAGHADVEELLLEHGADPNAQDAAGNTPLHVAAIGGIGDAAEVMFEINPTYDRSDIVRMLFEYGADPTVKNSYGKTPLDIALEMGNDEIAWLIAAKTPPEYKKRTLKTGLVEATPPAEKAPHRRPRRVAR
jgi:ankyrin repeat protein